MERRRRRPRGVDAVTETGQAASASTAAPTRQSPTARRIGWLFVAAVAVVAAVVATTASQPPATSAQRAYELKEATLCPVCDGQSVLESNAPAAAAMRRQIDVWVDAGRTDTEIRAELAAAYGNDVNALPPGDGVGTLVWALPVVVFAAAAAGLWSATRRWRRRASAVDGVTSGEAEIETDAGGASESAAAETGRLRRASVITVSALIVIGAAAGLLVARSTGLRLPGETISGEIDRSARSLLVDAQRQFAANQVTQARATLNEIFRIDRDLRGALLLSSRLHSAEGDVLSALTDLDRILAADPLDTEALSVRGWLLVRVPDPELIAIGIATLDAAVALDPAEFDPWVFRGYAARYIENDLAAAIRHYLVALDRNPPPAMVAQLESAISEMEAELETGLRTTDAEG